MQMKKRKMKIGEALVGMKRSGSQLLREGVSYLLFLIDIHPYVY